MKCPKNRPPLRSVSGKEIRPERTCDETLYDIRSDGVGSCPYHGLVEIPEIPEAPQPGQPTMNLLENNGKPKRWFNRG